MLHKFDTLSETFAGPSVDGLRNALSQRQNLSREQADFVTYVAGFTHYEFGKSLFPEFHLELAGSPFPLVIDHASRRIHVKFVINDLTSDLIGFSTESDPEPESEAGADRLGPVFHNKMRFRNLAGDFISWSDLDSGIYRCGKGFVDWNFGVDEEVAVFEVPDWQVGGFDVVIHYARCPARNLVVSLSRTFANGSVILIANAPDQAYNTSLRALRDNGDLRESLRRAYWFVLDINRAQDVADFLTELPARFELFPYELRGSYHLWDLRGRLHRMIYGAFKGDGELKP